jgi:hypothetical protein
MNDNWQERLACAVACSVCRRQLAPADLRILSSYSHEPICLGCKAEEERRPDYAETSKGMLEQCLAETEILYGDLGSYCYHHFYPFKC